MKYLLLLLFPIVCFSFPESHYQSIAAKILSGETEVTLPDRSRADIISTSHAIEVDFSNKWKEAIGQSLNYAFQTNLKAGIILITKDKDDRRYLIRLKSVINHYKLPIDLWVMDAGSKELQKFE